MTRVSTDAGVEAARPSQATPNQRADGSFAKVMDDAAPDQPKGKPAAPQHDVPTTSRPDAPTIAAKATLTLTTSRAGPPILASRGGADPSGRESLTDQNLAVPSAAGSTPLERALLPGPEANDTGRLPSADAPDDRRTATHPEGEPLLSARSVAADEHRSGEPAAQAMRLRAGQAHQQSLSLQTATATSAGAANLVAATRSADGASEADTASGARSELVGDVPRLASRVDTRLLAEFRGALHRTRADLAAPLADDAPALVERLPAPTILRRETHFAPIGRFDPLVSENDLLLPLQSDTRTSSSLGSALLDQLRAAIRSDATTPQSAADTASATKALGAPALSQLSQGPVRILELALQPASLGTMSVTLRLTPGGLKMTFTTSSSETAALLEEDREALRALIGDAGYALDDLVIATAPADALAAVLDRAAKAPAEHSPVAHSSAPPKELDVVARWMHGTASTSTFKV